MKLTKLMIFLGAVHVFLLSMFDKLSLLGFISRGVTYVYRTVCYYTTLS